MTHKHLFPLIIAAMLGGPAAAQLTDAVLTVNGQQATRTLTQITFDGDNVILHFTDGTETADMSTVAITLPATTRIDRVQTFATAQLVGDELTLGGLSRGERVTIYDASGRRMMQTTASDETLTISTTTLHKGVYIVKAGDKIIKFSRK
ncbi:MAG: T9SS type A sorting domain-containing protein [Prevotella sp.]|nr:T9SS type A sorting domain-containing protein [Prevotella sp.]